MERENAGLKIAVEKLVHELKMSETERKDLDRRLDLTRDAMERIEALLAEVSEKDGIIKEDKALIQTLKADNFTQQRTLAMNKTDLEHKQE